MIAGKRVLRYFKVFPEFGNTFNKRVIYMDGSSGASFATNLDTRQSTIGYLFMMGGGPVSFFGR